MKFLQVQSRFVEEWLNCNYDGALDLARLLAPKDLVRCAFFIAKNFGQKDLEVFSKLF